MFLNVLCQQKEWHCYAFDSTKHPIRDAFFTGIVPARNGGRTNREIYMEQVLENL